MIVAQSAAMFGLQSPEMPRTGCLQSVQMLQSVRELVLPAAQARLLLVVNHVVAREPAAVQRLKAHAGRRLAVALVDQPGWLPALPPMRVAITPAGLFDSDGDSLDAAPDLTLRMSMPAPPQLLAALTGGPLPSVHIEGAAAVAADMHWLADNLRWDIEADLAQAVGATPARLAMSVGRAARQALRRSFASAPDNHAR
jgi:ubiquinone biosynthesis accessory factor UbiJ